MGPGAVHKYIRLGIVFDIMMSRCRSGRLALGEERLNIRLLFPALTQSNFIVFALRMRPHSRWRRRLPTRTCVAIILLLRRLFDSRCSGWLHRAIFGTKPGGSDGIHGYLEQLRCLLVVFETQGRGCRDSASCGNSTGSIGYGLERRAAQAMGVGLWNTFMLLEIVVQL